MRVLQIGLSDNKGGIESFAVNYQKVIKKYDVYFDYISMWDCLAYEDEIKEMGGRILPVTPFMVNPYKYYCELKNILKQYNIVHINMLSNANILPLLACKRAKVNKIITHSHNTNTEGIVRHILHKFNTPIVSSLQTIKLSCADGAARWLYTSNIIKQKEYKVLHNAVSLDKYRFSSESRFRLRRELNIEEDMFVLGMVGRISREKNVLFALDVLSMLLKYNNKFILLHVGPETDIKYMGTVSEKINRLGLFNNVKFLGVRDDVNELYSVMDCFCMPSYYEGLSFTAIEAQVSGLKCLFANSMSIDTKIIDSVKFLSLGNVSSWIDCLINIKIETKERCLENLGVIGGEYDIDTQVKWLYDIYKKIE